MLHYRRFSVIERDALIALAYDEVMKSQRMRAPLVGAMFWNAALRVSCLCRISMSSCVVCQS